MNNSIITTSNQTAIQFNPIDIELISTMDEFIDAIKKINAIKPLVKLLNNIKESKIKLLLMEIEIAKKAVSEFPNDLKKIYKSDLRVEVALFWESKSYDEIDEIIKSTDILDFTGTCKRFIRLKNDAKIEKATEKIKATKEIKIIENEVAESIARENVCEEIRDRLIAEIESKLSEDLEDMRYAADIKAEAEYKAQYKKAIDNLLDDLPKNIKQIKEKIKQRVDEDFKVYAYADIDKILRDIICTEFRYNIETMELFRSYTTAYIRKSYDVCLGASGKNNTIYYLWDYATEPQRINDITNKVCQIINDMEKLSKRKNVSCYINNAIEYSEIVSAIILKMQQDDKS